MHHLCPGEIRLLPEEHVLLLHLGDYVVVSMGVLVLSNIALDRLNHLNEVRIETAKHYNRVPFLHLRTSLLLKLRT